MKFSVNGLDQGIAFRVAKSELAGRPLFPHVLTKNQVNVIVVVVIILVFVIVIIIVNVIVPSRTHEEL